MTNDNIMKFTKMHGIGNDYVYVNGFEERVADPAEVARRISDRHFGVGSDGLILILPSQKADVRMRMFNTDGSEGEMCGNGVRCVAKYACDHGLTQRNPMRVETGAGVLSIGYATDADGKLARATVDMGEPILELPKIPVNEAALSWRGLQHHYGIETGQICWIGTFVSMGNPHLVLFDEENEFIVKEGLAKLALEKFGPMLEKHPAFPNRMNVHVVQVDRAAEVTMRTWERGSGITLACGTGACAVAVAGVLTGRTARKVLVHLPGGDLTIEWREDDDHVYMTGPATEVFTGDWPE